MKRRKLETWRAQIKALITSLHFSALDAETQSCVNREMLFFNTRRLAVIAWVVIAVELLNIINVLFLSKSGLATVNNRQYFTMYLLLLASGAVCLVVRRFSRQKPAFWQWCCIAFALYWVLWHALLSAIDLRRNPSITVFIAGLFTLSFLVRLKPWESFCILPCAFLFLMICARTVIPRGIAINAAIVTLVSVLISCSRYFNMLEELGYRKKLILQANHRMEERQKLSLLLTQQKALLHYSHAPVFLWSKAENSLTLAGGNSLCASDSEALLSWLSTGRGDAHGTLWLYMTSTETPHEYRVESTVQLDDNNVPIGAVGTVTHAESQDPASHLKGGVPLETEVG